MFIQIRWIKTLQKFGPDNVKDWAIVGQLHGTGKGSYFRLNEYDSILEAASEYGHGLEVVNPDAVPFCE